jgi:hypothetical protein
LGLQLLARLDLMEVNLELMDMDIELMEVNLELMDMDIELMEVNIELIFGTPS